jgi:acyl-CoA dehydrogenase
VINLETPRKFRPVVAQAHEVAATVLRPISRRYDRGEHERPVELDMLAALIEGMNVEGASGIKRGAGGDNRTGATHTPVLRNSELSWGAVGLLPARPARGLANSPLAAVATEEQLEHYGGRWAAMAITEPEAGSDSAAIRTTAVRDGDEYVLNGEKIYVTSGERAELVVVWATLDRAQGRGAIKSFVVERSNPGLILERLEHKLGIRASDTAAFRLEDCRVPLDALLGSPEIKGFAGVMQTFDNTRPLVAAMAVGVTRACLEHTREKLNLPFDPRRSPWRQPAAAARLQQLEADYEAARLLTLQAAWMADNGKPNSLQASMAKAKAGRTAVDVALACLELTGDYGEDELLEKWARDAKILDIFEGTQQIQLLIIARQLLGKTSAELR